jgi:hypothetical protein
MLQSDDLHFTDDREKYAARSESTGKLVYTPALYLPSRVKPLCEKLQALATSANEVNVLNPVTAFSRLHGVRGKFFEIEPTCRAELEECLRRLAEPTEGAGALDLAWIQGFNSAAGMSASNSLNLAYSAVGEALDRKSAYSLACLSLYLSVVSIVATVVLGVMSLK